MGFQQGISGLNAASKNLDVIGHNIANSGTVGFKSSRAEFSSLVANSMAGFGCSSAGGTGFGVGLAAVSQQVTQGGINRTGNGLDVAINGGGFFKLQLADGSSAYTRAGNFKQDKTGGIVTNDGAKVMGYKVTGGVASSTPVPLSFPVGSPIKAEKTTKITATLNLDARATPAAGSPAVPAVPAVPPALGTPAIPEVPATPRSTYGTSVNIYDSLGVATPVNLYFEKDTTANEWFVYTSLDETLQAPGTGPKITFDPTTGAYAAATPPALTNLTLPLVPPATTAATIDVDFSGSTQFGSKFAVADLQQDGYASGELRGVNISADGSVMASYSNGITRVEAQMALSNFRNPQGLVAVGGNNWVASGDSGEPMDGKPGSGSFGTLLECSLEESNVDLTAELVNMMTAQRSYQANAQTIKTQDQVMSTLVNLR